MTPMTSTLLALAFALIGVAACAIMWELKGRQTPPKGAQKLLKAHRLLGRLFIVLLLVMVVMMVRKVIGYQEELSVRALVHTALAMALLSLAVVKVWVAKRLPNLSGHLFWLGTAIFTLAVALVGITAGHFLIHRNDLRYVEVDELGELALDTGLGRQLMVKRCNKCHSFERILLSVKERRGWEETVNRMAVYDAPNISTFEIRQITHALIELQKERLGKAAPTSAQAVGRSLVTSRCTRCHELDRIFAADKTFEQWSDTVERMMGHAGDPPLLTATEREAMLQFLTERGGGN